MFLWIGLHADQSFVSQVFGVNSMGQIDIEMVSLYSKHCLPSGQNRRKRSL